MSDNKIESLSALMDGESDELALHRTLKDVEGSPELKQTWSRYHIGSDAIKGTVSDFSHIDISSAVSAAIADQSFEGAEQGTNKGWLKMVGGFSIAASVTLAVVLVAHFNPLVDATGGQQFASETKVEIVTPEQTPRKGPLMIAQQQGSDLNSGLSSDLNEAQLQQAQERLNSYLKQHAQDSALGQGRTSMPFARVVNFETSNQGKDN
ncbi:MAG: sigma-E factor negative regulatory protein RseA [Psychrobacter glaciei]|jgi:sigma-E factor negative regulatory protein RseA